jgi:hypothetical protein
MGMKKSKIETARSLAMAHLNVDESVTRIFLLEPLMEENPKEPIRLLEVVRDTLERGIEPVGFAPDPARGIDYPSVIVEVSLREYAEIGSDVYFDDRSWTVGEELAAR